MPLPCRSGASAAVAASLAVLSVSVLAGSTTGTASLSDLPPRGRSSVLGRLPASWQGDIPDAGGTSRWHVDLAPDGSYQLRQTFLGRPEPNRFDAIGRWRLEPGTNRLVLRGGREAPLVLQPIEAGNALRKLDLQGKPIHSRQNNRLSRLPRPSPIDPSLRLQGLFTYWADAASIVLCATGQRLPVAMEGDYLALERAYTRAQTGTRAAQPLLTSLQGLISTRPSAEPGQPPQRTLVVETFVKVWPGQGCSPVSSERAETSTLTARPAAPGESHRQTPPAAVSRTGR